MSINFALRLPPRPPRAEPAAAASSAARARRPARLARRACRAGRCRSATACAPPRTCARARQTRTSVGRLRVPRAHRQPVVF
eukprot:scaffold110999_cov30-Tisochrysis_lutea.AAC.1